MKTFIVSSLQSSVQEVLDNALRGIETSNYGLEFRTKTNEIRYLLVNATTRRDAENNIVGVVGYVFIKCHLAFLYNFYSNYHLRFFYDTESPRMLLRPLNMIVL